MKVQVLQPLGIVPQLASEPGFDRVLTILFPGHLNTGCVRSHLRGLELTSSCQNNWAWKVGEGV